MDLEKVFGPLPHEDELPPQPPVLKVTQDRLTNHLRAVAGFLEIMADHVEKWPWGDLVFDDLNTRAGRLLADADRALAVYRETRDCRGRS